VQPLSQLRSIVIGPEVHEEEVRLLHEHVIVDGLDLNSMSSKSPDDRVYLITEQNEVPGDRRFASACRLEVDGGRCAHRGWDFHAAIGDLLFTGNTELKDAAFDLACEAQGLLDTLRVEIDRLGCSSWRSGRWCRGFRKV